ncbi:MAG: hypothetical protein Q6L68_03515 [Thermostichus sp. DG02_5_bins_236]
MIVVQCPECNSTSVVKYGKIHNGKQGYRYHSCHRQFVPNSTKKFVSKESKSLIDQLLLERLSLAAIARVAEVSETGLQDYVNHKVIYTSPLLENQPKKGGSNPAMR